MTATDAGGRAGAGRSAPRRGAARFLAAALLSLAVLVAAALLPLLDAGFVGLDDADYVTDNPWVQRGLTLEGLRRAFASDDPARLWHPLAWVSHMADVELYGLRPRGHHLTSLLLHAANAGLLLLLLLRATGARWRSLLVGALFAVHPLHVESVAWVSERKDVLYAFFWWLALLAYVRYARRPSPGRYALVTAAFALSLLAKPMAVTLPGVLLLLDLWPLGRLGVPLPGAGAGRAATGRPPARGPLLEKVPWLLLAAAAAAWTAFAPPAGAGAALARAPLSVRLGDGLVAAATYLKLAVWPAGLAPFYPRPAAGHAAVALAGAVLLALSVLALRRAQAGRPVLAFGWAWYLCTLFPVSGLVEIGPHAMADRYTYVPLVGPFVAVSWALAGPAAGRAAPRRAPAGAAVLAVALLVPLARAQAGYWRDGVTLFRRALAVTKDNPVARTGLGYALGARGDREGAIAQYRRALALSPAYPTARQNLVNQLLAANRTDEALAALVEGLAADPSARQGVGETARLLTEGRTDEALTELAAIVSARETLAEETYFAGMLLLARGRPAEARAVLARLLERRPGHAGALNALGWLLLTDGRTREAETLFRRALRARGGFAQAHTNLGIALAELGHLDEAEAEFAAAAALAPGDPAARDNLERVRGLRRGARP